MITWVLIIICGIITFLIRFLPLSGYFNYKGSKNYLRLINVIPIVVLSPIIFQTVFFISNNQIIITYNPKLYAAIIGILVSLLFKNVIYTILIGMSAFWIINEMISTMH